MGLFGKMAKDFSKAMHDTAKNIEDGINRSRAVEYIRGLVYQQYADLVEDMPATEDRFARITMALEAAAVLEAGLHVQAMVLMDQARADKHEIITLKEVHTVIVEAIRDIKMTVCEFDGTVSRADRRVIEKTANNLETKARSRFLTVQMERKPSTIPELSSALDTVEKAVAHFAVGQAKTDEERMRAEQAAIFEVAKLRSQQMSA